MSIEISASVVKQLRDTTGAGMMDCKKALQESNGDFEGAIEYLRKKGQKMTEKRADREAKEGVVIALTSADASRGIVIRVSCETDFVSKNEDFVKFVKAVADAAMAAFPATREEMLNVVVDGLPLGEKLAEKTGVIGEKVELAGYERIEAAQVVAYIHMGNRAGVILGLTKNSPAFEAPGKDVAMQIAAMKPIAVDKDDVDAAIIEKEIEIGKEQARNEGKPENLLEKIALGKLNAFYKEQTLLNQEYVKDNKLSVRQYLETFDKGLTVTGFKHLKLG